MGQDGLEALYGSKGYQFGAGRVGAGGEDFGPVGGYIDIGQCKCTCHFAEEGSLLVIRFDHCELDLRGPHLQGKGWKSGTGADVKGAERE